MQNDLDDILNVKIDDDSIMRDILGRLKLNNDYKLYLEFLTTVKENSSNAGKKLTTTIMSAIPSKRPTWTTRAVAAESALISALGYAE